MGAWIEIFAAREKSKWHGVAPLVGAWIEINNGATVLLNTESLLSWERGLKYELLYILCVNPCGSLLSWERGLKLCQMVSTAHLCGSLLSWERGLKYFKRVKKVNGMDVAPLVGAWIEIFAAREKSKWHGLSLLSWERGLKLLIHHNQFYLHLRRSSRGSVD